jgi:hypothetical protein
MGLERVWKAIVATGGGTTDRRGGSKFYSVGCLEENRLATQAWLSHSTVLETVVLEGADRTAAEQAPIWDGTPAGAGRHQLTSP